jgi:hypothetical protein
MLGDEVSAKAQARGSAAAHKPAMRYFTTLECQTDYSAGLNRLDLCISESSLLGFPVVDFS